MPFLKHSFSVVKVKKIPKIAELSQENIYLFHNLIILYYEILQSVCAKMCISLKICKPFNLQAQINCRPVFFQYFLLLMIIQMITGAPINELMTFTGKTCLGICEIISHINSKHAPSNRHAGRRV